MAVKPLAPGGVGYLLIGQPTLSASVARALATKGDQPQYLEGRYELGVTALDLTAFEYRWLRRINTFQAWASQAAVAAQNQGIQMGAGSIAGGAGRNMLTVLESVIICNENATSQRFHFGISNNTQGITAGPFFGFAADDRSTTAGVAQSNAFIGTQSSATALLNTNQAGIVVVPAGSSIEVRGPWIISGKLAPSVVTESFVVAGGQSNIIVTAGFRWWERELLASEQ